MCLAIPARVLDRIDADLAMIDAGGVHMRVSLALVPEAAVGDYVIVHAGFAISRLDEEEAVKVFEYLREMQELGEVEEGSGAGSA
jgi:hydrogenase expression/formation protein HypC